MKSAFILPLLGAILLSGCAYKLGTVHDPGYKRMFVENFRSDVDEPGLENLVSTTIVKQIQNDGTVQVTSLEDADVVLRGRIVEFKMTPVTYSRSNELTPTEATMSITASYTITRKGETSPLYKGRITGNTSLFIGNDLQSDKRQGVPLAAEDLGRQIISQIADQW